MAIVARDILQSDARSVDPEATPVQLESLVESGKVGGALVLRRDRLVGIVSRTDIVSVLDLVPLVSQGRLAPA